MPLGRVWPRPIVARRGRRIEPPFKVGDRVRYFNRKARYLGKPARIINITQYPWATNVTLRYEGSGMCSYYHTTKYLVKLKKKIERITCCKGAVSCSKHRSVTFRI